MVIDGLVLSRLAGNCRHRAPRMALLPWRCQGAGCLNSMSSSINLRSSMVGSEGSASLRILSTPPPVLLGHFQLRGGCGPWSVAIAPTRGMRIVECRSARLGRASTTAMHRPGNITGIPQESAPRHARDLGVQSRTLSATLAPTAARATGLCGMCISSRLD